MLHHRKSRGQWQRPRDCEAAAAHGGCRRCETGNGAAVWHNDPTCGQSRGCNRLAGKDACHLCLKNGDVVELGSREAAQDTSESTDLLLLWIGLVLVASRTCVRREHRKYALCGMWVRGNRMNSGAPGRRTACTRGWSQHSHEICGVV